MWFRSGGELENTLSECTLNQSNLAFVGIDVANPDQRNLGGIDGWADIVDLCQRSIALARQMRQWHAVDISGR